MNTQRQRSALGHYPRRALGADPNLLDLVQSAKPYAEMLLKDDDPTEDVETLKARIRNHEAIRNASFEPIRTLYQNKINVLKARLRAAKKRQTERRKDTASKWEWSNLGKFGAVIGIATGVAVLSLIVNASGAARRAYRPAAAANGVTRKRRRVVYRGAA